MLQLIVNGIYLPETSHDRYQCWPDKLGTQLDMISGRRVEELRGTVQKVAYSCDYLPDSVWRPLQAVLRGGGSFSASYLPDDGDALIASRFFCESLTHPSFAFARHGRAYWHNIAFTLREETPHD